MEIRMTTRISAIIEDPRFERTVITVICLNALVLGIETFPSVMQTHGTLLRAIDLAFIVFFVGELSLRIYVHRAAFFHWKQGWNWFDFIIVALTMAPFVENASALRTLRILRALRLVSVVPALRNVVTGIGRAIGGFAAVLGVLVLLHYVAAVMASQMFGQAFPEKFGNLFISLFTFFQIMTLDAWSDVARPVMEVYPWSWLLFVFFIATTVFLLLSVIVGIAANAMQEDTTSERLRSLEDKIDELTKLMSSR